VGDPPDEKGKAPKAPESSGGFVSRGRSGEYTITRSRQFGGGRFELHRDGRVVISRNGETPSMAEIVAAQLAAGVPTAAVGGEGVTGLSAYSGVISDDYNADLQDLQGRMEMFEQMRRSDAALAVMENLITMTILAAQFRLEGGDSEAFRLRFWDDLENGMSHAYTETLREALLAVLYGFAIHEVVGEVKADGFEGIKKFQELGRTTVKEWDFDAGGGVQGFTQEGYRLDDDSWIEQYIPVERLVIWTWREDMGNPEGVGAFRQAYKHWRIKETLENWAAMRVERTAIPVPIFTPPAYNMNFKDRDLCLEMADRIIANQNQGICLPMGWQLKLEWPGPSDIPWMELIEWEHMNILQAILGQFVGYGSGGQQAGAPLGRESASVFLLSVNWIADWLCDTFNRHVIPKVWARNYGTKWVPRRSKTPPKLAHTRIGLRDLDEFGRAIRSILDKNTMMTPELLAHLLSMADVPPQTDEDLQRIVDVKFSSGSGKQGGAGDGRFQDESRTTPSTTSAENGADSMLGG